MSYLLPESKLFLLIGSFAGGFLDAVVGGGGVVQIPAFMLAYPSLHPSVILATNKAASVLGTAYAAVGFARKIRIRWLELAVFCCLAATAAYLASHVAPRIPPAIGKTLILFSLAFMFVNVLLRPEFGAAKDQSSRKFSVVLAGGCAVFIGLYDGLLGPGVGLLAVFLLHQVAGFDFLKSSFLAKSLNVVSNVAALAYFAPNGYVLWEIAAFMFFANFAGSVVGFAVVMRFQHRVFRAVFLTVALLLIGKLIAPYFTDV